MPDEPRPSTSPADLDLLFDDWLASDLFSGSDLPSMRTLFKFPPADASRLLDGSGAGHASGAEGGFDPEAPTPAPLPPALRSLPKEVAALLHEHLLPVRFAAGETILRQGDPGASLLLIQTGLVDVHATDDRGRRLELGRCGAGAILGEMALLTNEPRSASAEAVTEVEALELAAGTFDELARAHPALLQVLTEIVASRLGRGPRDALAGKTFHGYLVRRRLGRGGMSVVYDALDGHDGARVALKMMSHRLAGDASAADRFRREAELVAAFHHPNIVRTRGRFAAFRTEFIVLEFVPGWTLAEWRTRVAKPPAEAIRRILGQTVAALVHAHEAGVVHRDVKPGNVMLDRQGVAKLMDFGLAQPLAELAAGPEGLVVGTPRYMAPEQLVEGRATPESDLFSLGCLAFELCTGRPLIDEPSLSKIVVRHFGWRTQSFADLCPEAPPDVADALAWTLHPRAEQRRLDVDRLLGWSTPLDPEWLGPDPCEEDDE